MAMVKCPTCGKMVSNSSAYCPYCDGLIDKQIKCPKCGSVDVELNIKMNEKHTFLETIASAWIGVAGVLIGRLISKKGLNGDATSIKYSCKSCGKRFSRK